MERIWVGYRPAATLAGKTYYHKILYYENGSGVVRAIEALPQYGTADNLLDKALKYFLSEYSSERNTNPVLGHIKVAERGYLERREFDNGPWQGGGWERELISEGADLSGTWNKMKQDAADINTKYEYRPEQQNSNSTVDEIIKRSGLTEPTEQVGENQFPTPGNNRPLIYPLTTPAGPGLSDGPVHEFPPSLDKLDKYDDSEHQPLVNVRPIQQSVGNWAPDGYGVFDDRIPNPNAQRSLSNVLSIGQVGVPPTAEQIWARLKSGPRRQTDSDEEWYIRPQSP